MRIPSLFVTILVLCIYLFAAVPLIYGLAHLLSIMGVSFSAVELKFIELVFSARALIVITIIVFLLKRYHGYLLSFKGQADIIVFLKVGIKWSIPLLIIHFVGFIIPGNHEALVESNNIIKKYSIYNTSLLITCMVSLLLILSVLAEELIFRGLVLQKLSAVVSEKKSAIVSAGLFSFFHLVTLSFAIDVIISTFVVGLLCGFAFISTKSCISAFIPHLIQNLVIIGYLWAF